MIMNCRWCEKEIDYDTKDKIALEPNGEKHDCPKAPWNVYPNKPKRFPKKWVKKEYKPMEGTLDKAAVDSRLDALDELVAKHDEAIKALVQQMSFQKGNSTEVANESAQLMKDAMNEKPQPRPSDE